MEEAKLMFCESSILGYEIKKSHVIMPVNISIVGKNKTKKQPNRDCYSIQMFHGRFYLEITFDARPEWNEKVSHGNLWRKNLSGRGRSKGEMPWMGMCLAYMKFMSVSGKETVKDTPHQTTLIPGWLWAYPILHPTKDNIRGLTLQDEGIDFNKIIQPVTRQIKNQIRRGVPISSQLL